MRKLHDYLSNISLFKFTIITVIPQLILTLFAFWIGSSIIPFPSDFNSSVTTSNMNSFMLFISIGIIGPFIETLIFQCFVINIFLSFSKSDTRRIKIISIIGSGLIFGFLHYLNTKNSNLFWSIWYGFKSGLFGVILGYAYVLYYSKTNVHTKAFLVTFLIHALNNSLAFAIPNI